MRHPVTTSLFFLAFLMAAARVPAAAPDGDVDRVLALDEAPFGVVFEVVSGDPDALNASSGDATAPWTKCEISITEGA